MHFWKLLATIAIRYHLLKNQAERQAPTGDSDQHSVLPPMMRTGTNRAFFPKSSKIWFGTHYDLVGPLLNNLTASLNVSDVGVLDEGSLVLNTTDSPLLNGAQHVTKTTVANTTNSISVTGPQNASKVETVPERGAQPSIKLHEVLPHAISYFRINETWYNQHPDSLPKLTWLVLTTGLMTTVAYPSCARWNCPCSGSSRRGERSTGSLDLQLLRRTTATAQQQTLQLLKKLENTRFRGNEDHIYALKRCSELRHEECMVLYVVKNCSLEGLPSMSYINQHAENLQFEDFLKDSRMILATIAMFIDKVRREEQQHYGGYTKSMDMDLQMVEELGIYHMLCAMDKGLRGTEFTELPAELTCDAKLSRAKADNRNYIVLHTFQKYLRTLLSKVNQTLESGTA